MSAPVPNDDTVLLHDEVDAALFWHTHKKTILLWTLVAVAVIGGGLTWYVTSTLKTKAATTALAEAKDIPQLEAVVRDFKGTQPGADATLLLAGAYQSTGKLAESTAAFQDFLKTYPKNPLAGAALLGIGQNQDAAGDPAAALATYQQVVETYPKSYAAPFAGYVQAEILLRDYRRDEAKTALDSLISQFPESLVARLAGAQLARLGAKNAGAPQ